MLIMCIAMKIICVNIIAVLSAHRGERRVYMEYCHYDYEDEKHDCLDYMECEECPYYYADMED